MRRLGSAWALLAPGAAGVPAAAGLALHTALPVAAGLGGGYRFPGRGLFEWAVLLPLAVPAFVIGFAFLGLFDFTGPVQAALRAAFGPGARLPDLRAWWGVVVTMTLGFYPYVYLLARAAFREQGAATLETARSLGRSRCAAFRQVTLPLARPSLAAGVSFAMMGALAALRPVAAL